MCSRFSFHWCVSGIKGKKMTTDTYKQIEEQKILLQQYFDDNLSKEQRSKLAQWLMSSRTNREMLMRLKDRNRLYRHWKESQTIDSVAEYQSFHHRIKTKQRRKLLKKIAISTASAAALILMFVGVAELMIQPEEQSKVAVTIPEPTKITYHSSDGEVIEIDEKTDVTTIIEQKKTEKSSVVKYSEVVVPDGLDTKFILPDGSEVHLNSNSKIRFPERFAATDRVVEFEGEVYFNVTRDTLRPFIVQSGNFSVKVLGTVFIARASGKNYSATLAEGSVGITYGTKSLVLTPGERGALKNGELVCSEADLEKEFDWVRGEYVFNDEPLETIVDKLSQFYGVEFIFVNDDIKEYLFTGKISREKEINLAIQSLEMTNIIKFHQKGNIISITKNR